MFQFSDSFRTNASNVVGLHHFFLYKLALVSCYKYPLFLPSRKALSVKIVWLVPLDIFFYGTYNMCRISSNYDTRRN